MKTTKYADMGQSKIKSLKNSKMSIVKRLTDSFTKTDKSEEKK